MTTTVERKQFVSVVRSELARLGVKQGYIIFAVYGPYDHNRYDAPMGRNGMHDARFPVVYRALYEAVEEIQGGPRSLTKLLPDGKFRVDVVDGSTVSGVRNVLAGQTVWRSWRDGRRDRARTRRPARRRVSRRRSRR